MTQAQASERQQAREHAALARSIEAVLFTTDRPVSARRLGEALGLIEPPIREAPVPEVVVPARARRDASDAERMIADSVATLNREYGATGRVFRIETVSGGYRVVTLPEMAGVLAAFHRSTASSRLSRAAIETLSIIAYRQPVTRAQLEAIRGVACGEVLRSLLERRLITIKGRAEELGRPMLYGTTREFLDSFGLASLKDLPTPAEIAGGA